MKNATKKVGMDPVVDDEPKAKKVKKDRKKRPVFNFASALDSAGNVIPLDEEGRLKAIPVNWKRQFAQLTRKSFAEPALFFEFRASLVDSVIAGMKARRDEMILRAKESREGLSPTEKAIRKRAQLMKKLEQLDALLEEEGVSID